VSGEREQEQGVGAGSRDLESGERGFLILWTYKIVGGNIYYRGRINEYPSMVVGERIFYHG
jgi:hypothetical protein